MHPFVFDHLHSYGVMMAVAFLAGFWTASRRCVRDGLPPDRILDLGPWLIIGAILGARILYVTTYWKESFAGRPFVEVFMIWTGGLVYYGGLIGAALGCVLYARLKSVPLWKLADALAPSIALGYVFGRIGCFLNGCCYGRACDLPWAVRYPADNSLHPPTYPVHPTQLYDSLMNLGLYLGLAWMYRRKKFDGQIFAIYLMCYAVTRSIAESFRGDYDAAHFHTALHLTPAQMVSLGIFAAGAVLFGVLWRHSRRRPALVEQRG